MAGRVMSPVLVGRELELARLAAALQRAAAGEVTTVVVGGDAGVGKTRLVSELGTRAEAAGMRCLVGGCLDVGDGTVPFAPFAEAFRSLARGLDADAIRQIAGPALPAVVQL